MNVIIDCDPGGYIATGLDIDDDLALIIALSLHRLEVINILGVTITAGNTQLQFSLENAYELIHQQLGYNHREIPIYSGSPAGNSNNERWLWPITTTSLFNNNNNNKNNDSYYYDNFYRPTNASQFIIDTIMGAATASPGNNEEGNNNNGNNGNDMITILALGPLGNIASAYQQKPEIANHIEQIVMMGGILSPKHKLDYNFRYSPKAASIVLGIPCKKVMIPVETSIQFVFSQHDLNIVLNKCQKQKQSYKKEQETSSTTTMISNQSPPVICTYQTRLMLQRHIMPYVVNWRYSDIKPQSKYFDNGFILWDVVALLAMINNNTTSSSSSLSFFENWIYYDVSKFDLEKDEEEFRHSTSGNGNGKRNEIVFQPTVLVADDQNNNRLDDDVNENWWWKDRVIVPQTIISEEYMKEFIFEHLFLMEKSKATTKTDDDSSSPTVVLTISSRLGLLPNIIIFFCLFVIILIVVFKKIIIIIYNNKNSRIIRMSSSSEEEETKKKTISSNNPMPNVNEDVKW